MQNLTWKMGFEVELLAPHGVSRLDLANRVAQRTGGRVERFFHPQSEPSKVENSPTFENLTLGFKILDAEGETTASFVDDLTLQGDLERRSPPVAGWYRILADDARLLRLAMLHCDPAAPAKTVLDPLAALFGTKPQHHDGDMVRIIDDRQVSVAICAPLPGERDRPCEIVTAPIAADHAQILGDLLADARALGFTIPLEGATHIHYDAAALCSARTIANMVALFERYGEELKRYVGVNAHCSRLGTWPPTLRELTESAQFGAMDWTEARAALAKLPLSKYCDFNLLNIAAENKAKHTFEVRILPSVLEAKPILDAASLFENLLTWCKHGSSHRRDLPQTLPEMIDRMKSMVAA